MRELFAVALLRNDFEVRRALDGSEALRALSEHRPDVLVTDIMMPHLNGVDLVRLVRERADLAELPIVVLSAYPSYLSKAYLIGATEVLRKPVELNELPDVVLKALTKGTEH